MVDNLGFGNKRQWLATKTWQLSEMYENTLHILGWLFFALDLSKSLDIIEQKISSSIFSNAYNFSWLCRPHYMYVRGAIAIGKIEEVLLDSHLSSHKCEHHHDKLVSLVLSY